MLSSLCISNEHVCMIIDFLVPTIVIRMTSGVSVICMQCERSRPEQSEQSGQLVSEPDLSARCAKYRCKLGLGYFESICLKIFLSFVITFFSFDRLDLTGSITTVIYKKKRHMASMLASPHDWAS